MADDTTKPFVQAAGDGAACRVVAGRYQLIALLGRSNHSVWRAHDRKLGRDVAIKLLRPGSRSEAAAMLEGEARLLARLRHPSIVKIHDAGQSEELVWVAMDLVPGLSLAELLDRLRPQRASCPEGSWSGAPNPAQLVTELGAVPPGGQTLINTSSWHQTAAAIIVQALRGLEAAHAQGVVHRDLKPGNVMLQPGAVPVLIDFGFGAVQSAVPGTLTNAALGTLAYVPPERVRGSTVTDPRSDVYQMSVVLYELLSLRPAFPGESQRVLADVAQGRCIPLRQLDPTIPRGLAAVCAMAMDTDPRARYPTADAMRLDLERCLAGLPPTAGQPRRAWWRAIRSHARRHRRLVLTGAALLVGAVLAYGTMTVLTPYQMRQTFLMNASTGTELRLRGAGSLLHGLLDQPECTLGTEITLRRPALILGLWLNGNPTTHHERVIFATVDTGTERELAPGTHTVIVHRPPAAMLDETLTLRWFLAFDLAARERLAVALAGHDRSATGAIFGNESWAIGGAARFDVAVGGQ